MTIERTPADHARFSADMERIAAKAATFTPGPWQFDVYRNHHGTTEARIFNDQGGTIAKLDGDCVQPPANARLIAKAPELFALVARLLEQADKNERAFKGTEGSEAATERDLTLFDAWQETLSEGFDARALLAAVRGEDSAERP